MYELGTPGSVKTPYNSAPSWLLACSVHLCVVEMRLRRCPISNHSQHRIMFHMQARRNRLNISDVPASQAADSGTSSIQKLLPVPEVKTEFDPPPHCCGVQNRHTRHVRACKVALPCMPWHPVWFCDLTSIGLVLNCEAAFVDKHGLKFTGCLTGCGL